MGLIIMWYKCCSVAEIQHNCYFKKFMLPERKLYQKLKKNTPNILWNRIENLSLLGMPDLLGYNKNNQFFTVELKVVKGTRLDFRLIKLHGINNIRRIRLS